jgi:hypothetical protein
VAENIKVPIVKPTASNTSKADALDAAVSNPDDWCLPGTLIEHHLSSKLYPVNAFGVMSVSASLLSGVMELIPSFNSTASIAMEDGTYIQERWFYEETIPHENATADISMEDGTYVQTRWFFEETIPHHNATANVAMEGGSYIKIKIEADSEDEELQITADISADCSMDLV